MLVLHRVCYYGCFKVVSKSVQALLTDMEAVTVLAEVASPVIAGHKNPT